MNPLSAKLPCYYMEHTVCKNYSSSPCTFEEYLPPNLGVLVFWKNFDISMVHGSHIIYSNFHFITIESTVCKSYSSSLCTFEEYLPPTLVVLASDKGKGLF